MQESHHHNVEGLQESCQLCKTECSGACELDDAFDSIGQSAMSKHTSEQHEKHSHQHSHFPYPNADHPLGPITLNVTKEVSKDKEN